MTCDERVRFIDEELRGLWPQWDPTEAEIRVWMGLLARYPYGVARTALQQYFCTQAGSYHRPRPAGFVAKVKALIAPMARRPDAGRTDADPLIFIECIEPPPWSPHLAGVRKPLFMPPGPRRDDPDHIRACAEATRQRFEQLYAGRWITILTQPPTSAPPNSALAPNQTRPIMSGGPDGRVSRVSRDDCSDPVPIANALADAGAQTSRDGAPVQRDQFWRQAGHSADIELEQERRRTYS